MTITHIIVIITTIMHCSTDRHLALPGAAAQPSSLREAFDAASVESKANK